VSARLSADQLADCFSTALHQANLEVIWQRLEL
jgi:adenylosuccinate lyase